MFFLLSKILSFLLVPFNWCLLLLVLGIVIRGNKLKKYLWSSAIIVFLLFSNTLLFQKTVTAWEYPIENLAYAASNNKPIVILGGLSSFDDKTKRIHFKEATDRLMQGLLLHKMDTTRQIIISGGSAEIYFEEQPEAQYLKDYLLAIGVAPNKILFEKESRNTHENALYTAALFDSVHIKKEIALITSGFHITRAMGCFQKQGFEVEPIAANAFTHHHPLKPTDYFMPSLETLQAWPILIKEWVGICVYKLKGYL